MKPHLQTLIRESTIGFLSLAIAFCASPVFGQTLTRQTFSGNFTLLNSSTFGDPFPPSTDYSGFVSYDQNNRLLDWEVKVEELSLSLNPEANEFTTPTVTFELSSPSNWNLAIDFGIALDLPLYTLQRDSGAINFSLNSFGSFFNYADPAANIDLTSASISVPEPSPLLASLAFLGTITLLKRKRSIT